MDEGLLAQFSLTKEQIDRVGYGLLAAETSVLFTKTPISSQHRVPSITTPSTKLFGKQYIQPASQAVSKAPRRTSYQF